MSLTSPQNHLSTIPDHPVTTLKHYGVLGMKWGVRKRELPAKERVSRQQRLEAQYRKEMSPALAKSKAARRVKIERAAVIGGAAVGAIALAAAAYGGSRYLSREMSPINIAKNTSLQNVNMYGDKLKLERAVFATYKKSDNKRYATKFVEQLMGRGSGTMTAYKTELKAKTDILAPSKRQAERYFQQYKDFKKRVDGVDLSRLSYEKWHRSAYSSDNMKADNEFFRFMRNRGYNALQDVLDQNGQFKAKTPLLIFDGTEALSNVGSTVLKTRQ